MVKIILILFPFCILSAHVLAQDSNLLQGLDEADTKYISLGEVDTFYLNRGEPLPPANFSYRKYIKIPVFDQGFVPGCVGYAIASAVAIRMNMYCNSYCNCIKSQESFSASYIFNQVSGGKLQGISLAVALDTLQKQGICPEVIFKNDRYSASKQPDNQAREIANQFRFWKAERIFFLPDELHDEDTRNAVMLQLLKVHISKSKPVIVGLRCPDDFKNFVGKIYEPDKLPYNANHAALIIGYDDEARTVEILNSFGDDWGDEGFCFIKYEDFYRMARYGFVARLDGIGTKTCVTK